MSTAFPLVSLEAIRPSSTNPRKHFDRCALEELAESVRRHGILQPILIRPKADKRSAGTGSSYELVAGERRFRAAQAAGLKEIPAVVRDLSDLEALEIQVVENLHRADLHPMEEAEGYELLHQRHKYSVDDLAAKVGKSKAYVYGRLKLCALTKEAREAFLADQFSAGHAVILARLPAEKQRQALNPESKALLEYDESLWSPRDEDLEPEPLRARSVRQLQAWVDEHVRFTPEMADLMFEPEAVATIAGAEDEGEKLLAITREHQTPSDARDGGPKVVCVRSWKRADGEEEVDWRGRPTKSKTCEHSQPAIVAIGPGRGEAFRVCIAKKKCKIHWAAELREAAKRAKAITASSSPATPRKPDKWEIEQQKAAVDRERWKKATPAIAEALAARVKELPIEPSGAIVRYLLDDQTGCAEAAALVPVGNSAEDIIRHLAFAGLYDTISDSWWGYRNFPKLAKAFGIDVAKILDEVAPKPRVQTSAQKKAAEKKASKKAPAAKGKSPKRPARAKAKA